MTRSYSFRRGLAVKYPSTRVGGAASATISISITPHHLRSRNLPRVPKRQSLSLIPRRPPRVASASGTPAQARSPTQIVGRVDRRALRAADSAYVAPALRGPGVRRMSQARCKQGLMPGMTNPSQRVCTSASASSREGGRSAAHALQM